ncbi:DUF4269 domain-containing protein [Hymenobacter jeollabukensis]|uniref:DUF4269 domain-containing protein n=1 Tax=Hymenobacter jeollabukensis TaxID=2025313 RepID=A0A5R8WHE0_9BACT|nr:DUF4269 domain-containing protein [Hymenobacter jeollabukensis]TLM87886.1 DUF4269 domain-containing protein [Hymenobacter jeollabukensis]
MRNWHDIEYLQAGTPRQRAAHAALRQLGILATLQSYGPVLAGTIPLAVDVASSDLDLICDVSEAQQPAFGQLLRHHYGQLPGFELRQARWQERPMVVSRFRAVGFDWEIFAQPLPALQQQAVRHLQVEHAVLQAGGENWRRAVQALKAQGLKTEPAFAQLLGLPGDPYVALLALESWSAAELRAYVAGCTTF